MRFYEYGDKDAKTLMLIHDSKRGWDKCFEQLLPLLWEDFHVIMVSLDGYDDLETTSFKSVSAAAARIESFVRKELSGRLYGVYGAELGANIVCKLLSDRKIRIAKAVMDSAQLYSFGILNKPAAALKTAVTDKLRTTASPLLLKLAGVGSTAARDKAYSSFVGKESLYSAYLSSLSFVRGLSEKIGKGDVYTEFWYTKGDLLSQYSAGRLKKLIPSVRIRVFDHDISNDRNELYRAIAEAISPR
ncbi:MAG: hypothetical protein LBL82_00025 [Oscillospiraceae bacterium]|jgi:hypothetical protein|nr:hypothetical protein [Oscillospiraceae bacterium]